MKRDKAIAMLVERWADNEVKSNQLAREMWNLKTQNEQIKQKLQKYGEYNKDVEREVKERAEMAEMDNYFRDGDRDHPIDAAKLGM